MIIYFATLERFSDTLVIFENIWGDSETLRGININIKTSIKSWWIMRFVRLHVFDYLCAFVMTRIFKRQYGLLLIR